jgi:hypothetical protein
LITPPAWLELAKKRAAELLDGQGPAEGLAGRLPDRAAAQAVVG